ncbi:MAG TPA: hypothetical protein VHW46_09320 [Terracidiphilus sp.]|jgi:hypothetical protein|nr:hypothetical protein [Terracidiphilus sp.]
MSVRHFLLCFSLLACTAAVPAQETNKPATIRANDGGQTGPMQSIFVPPKAGAPFSLNLAAEWTRPLANGGTYTLVNERKIARDAAGRIYQERWILVPKGGTIQSQMNVFQITDPEMHTWYNCEPAVKVCELLKYRLTTEDTYVPAIGTSGPLPEGRGKRLHEDLGTNVIEGVETHGYRETLTLNPGTMGNDRPMETTREFWWSPELALNLMSIVDSPQAGKQVFTVKNLATTPPEPRLFVVPDDYKVVDHREEN